MSDFVLFGKWSVEVDWRVLRLGGNFRCVCGYQEGRQT